MNGPGGFDWRGALARLEAGFAPNTMRAYRSDFARFAEWSEGQGMAPVPAAPEQVAAFLGEEAGTCRPATLRRRLAAIRKVHRLLRLPDPTRADMVAVALRRAARSRGVRPQQSLGLTRARRDALIAACGDDLRGLRNRALIAVGYDTLCRRAELVALRVEDLVPRARGGLSVAVRRSREAPEVLARTAWISVEGALLLRAWLEAAGIERGPLFRPVYRGVPIRRFLNPYTVTRVLKELAAAAGLPANETVRTTGHSLRVGAAQDLMSDGRDILTIMRAGGWTSTNVVSRYVEEADCDLWTR